MTKHRYSHKRNRRTIRAFFLFLGIISAFITETKAEQDPGNDRRYREIPLYAVKQDGNRNNVADLLGDTVTVRGVANISSGLLHENFLQIFIQNEKVGLSLFSESVETPVSVGDSIVATGVVKEYYGLTEINVIDYKVTGRSPKPPPTVSLSQAVHYPSRYEGMLIAGLGRIRAKGSRYNGKYLLVSPESFPDDSIMVYVTNFHVRYNEFDFESLSAGDDVSVKGILTKYNPNPDQADANTYKIHLRTPDDLKLAGISKRQWLFWGALILGLTTLVIVWIVSLRQTVNRNTKELKKSLEEKETLLKEIHHRIKNNLAIMSGLFELQLDTTENAIAQKVLRDSQSRLQSVALVHDKLYQASDLQDINMEPYIKELVRSLKNTMSGNEKNVSIHFEIEPLYLNIDQAVPCGLLINEVVTNAFKHAFKGRDEGQLHITLQSKGQHAELVIADDGSGIPDDIDLSSGNSLGMLLIETFKDQLDARADMKTGPEKGTRYTFLFPLG